MGGPAGGSGGGCGTRGAGSSAEPGEGSSTGKGRGSACWPTIVRLTSLPGASTTPSCLCTGGAALILSSVPDTPARHTCSVFSAVVPSTGGVCTCAVTHSTFLSTNFASGMENTLSRYFQVQQLLETNYSPKGEGGSEGGAQRKQTLSLQNYIHQVGVESEILLLAAFTVRMEQPHLN